MKKQKLTLSIDDELIKIAKYNNLNISEFLEKCLCNEYNLIEIKTKYIKKVNK